MVDPKECLSEAAPRSMSLQCRRQAGRCRSAASCRASRAVPARGARGSLCPGERIDLVTLATNVLILSLLAISFDLLLGPTPGIMSFGQALFFGVAGYVIALVGRDLDFSHALGHAAAGHAGRAAARRPCSRPSCCSGASRRPRSSWRSARSPAPTPPSGWSRGWQYVGAGNGISSVKLLQLGSLRVRRGARLLLPRARRPGRWSMPGARSSMRSQFGLVLAGMRQNEERLAFFGYRVQLFKALVFSLAGMIAGLGGALYATTRASSGPATWARACRRTAVIYCLFGGSGTLIGPVLGTAAVEVLTYVLADIDASSSFWPVILGLRAARRGHVPAQGPPRARRVRARAHRLATAARRPGTEDVTPWRCSRSRASASRSARCRRSTGVDLDVEAGTVPRPDRPQRLGQEHADEGDRRRALRRPRHHRVRRPRHHPRDALRARPRRPQPQVPDHRVLPELSVYDNVLLALQAHATARRRCSARARARALRRARSWPLLERFRLIDRADDLAGALSHGEQQWLEIAMALALEAQAAAARRAHRRHEPGGAPASPASCSAPIKRALRAPHRRARPRLHPRHLRRAHGARPGQRARPGDVETIQRQPKVQQVYTHPCLTRPSSTSTGSATFYGRSQALFDVDR